MHIVEINEKEIGLLVDVLKTDKMFCRKLGLVDDEDDIDLLEGPELLEAFDEYSRITNSLIYIIKEGDEVIGTANLNNINYAKSNAVLNYNFLTNEYSMTRSALLHDLLLQIALDLGIYEVIEVATNKTITILNMLNYYYTAEPLTMNTMLLTITTDKELEIDIDELEPKIYN